MSAFNDEFRRNFMSVIKRVSDRSDLVVQKVGMRLGQSLVLKSPVDTGRFRGNWQYGAGKINTDTNGREDRSGSSSMGRIVEGLNSWRTGEMVYITNSLPYARVIEYGLFGKPPGSANGPKTVGGYSRQAPAGMVRLTVTEFKTMFRESVGEAKK